MQQTDTGVITLLAGEALATRRRVRFSGATQDTIVYADAGEACIGVTQDAIANAARGPVKLIGAPGTFEVEASAATSINAKLYGSADGKVAETVSGQPEFYGRYAASGSGSIIECVPISAQELLLGSGSGRDFQDSVSDRLTVPAGTESAGDRILVIATASGAFAGKENNIAVLEQDATWTFIAPSEGMMCYVEDEDIYYSYSGSAWVTAVEFGGFAIKDGGNIAVGTSTGTEIGTAAAQKLGFWGATPVVQQSHIADPAATASDPDALTATAIAAANATTPGTGADGTTPSGAEYTTCADLANELKTDYTALLADVTSIRTQVVALIDDVQANNAAIDSINALCATLGITAAS